MCLGCYKEREINSAWITGEERELGPVVMVTLATVLRRLQGSYDLTKIGVFFLSLVDFIKGLLFSLTI